MSLDVKLEGDAIYLSPCGRACRLERITLYLHRPAEATFLYDSRLGSPSAHGMADGFTLSKPNWRLLRRVN